MKEHATTKKRRKTCSVKKSASLKSLQHSNSCPWTLPTQTSQTWNPKKPKAKGKNRRNFHCKFLRCRHLKSPQLFQARSGSPLGLAKSFWNSVLYARGSNSWGKRAFETSKESPTRDWSLKVSADYAVLSFLFPLFFTMQTLCCISGKRVTESKMLLRPRRIRVRCIRFLEPMFLLKKSGGLQLQVTQP